MCRNLTHQTKASKFDKKQRKDSETTVWLLDNICTQKKWKAKNNVKQECASSPGCESLSTSTSDVMGDQPVQISKEGLSSTKKWKVKLKSELQVLTWNYDQV